MNLKEIHYNTFSYRIRFVLIFGIMAGIIAMFAYLILLTHERNNLENHFYDIATGKIAYKNEMLDLTAKQLKDHLFALKNNDHLERYFQDPSPQNRALVQNSFILMLEAMQPFFQIRLIDRDGVEEIRIDRDEEDNILIITQDQLQDKSKRYYVTHTQSLQDGEYYISDFNLNIEHGKIVEPYQPTIRISAPIYRKNTYRGMLIINLRADLIIHEIMYSDFFDVYTLDQDGYFLTHPTPEKQWAGILGTGFSIAQDHPQEAMRILNGEDTPEEFLFVHQMTFTDHPFYLLLKLREKELQESLRSVRKTTYKISLILFASLIILALIAAVIPERLYRSLIRQSQELSETMRIIDKHIIYSKTDSRGIITEASSAFCEISGYSKEELQGQPHSLIRHPDNSSELFEEIWETIQSGESWQGEIRNLTKKGTPYYVYSTISPEKDNKGHTIGYISIRQDITDRKTVEAQQRQLIAQSRHAAMGEMISIIAHQWKQPINSLALATFNLYTQTLQSPIDPEKAESLYQTCEETLQGMGEMIEDFRNFFKPNKLLHPIKLQLMIDESLKFLDHYFRVHQITARISIPEDAEVSCVKNEFEQVLINIIKNACDEFRSRNINNPQLNFQAKISGERIRLLIEDNAGGIPGGIITHIFDPYFSTKAQNGTGIGLYMSKMIIEESLGGKIQAENMPDGARFIIELPVHQSESNKEESA